MIPAVPKVGFVFRYSYLWSRLQIKGREEGDKDRPCPVLAIVAVEVDGSKIVRVLPITHSPPYIRAVETANGYFGALPPALFAEVKRRFVELARGRAHAAVARTE